MDSALFNLANAIKEALNAHTFDPAFTATVETQPRTQLEQITGLLVYLVPNKQTHTQATRAARFQDISIGLAIQAPTVSGTAAQADTYCKLADDICDFLFTHRQPADTGAQLLSIDHGPIWFPEHLAAANVFTTTLTLNYRRLRS